MRYDFGLSVGWICCGNLFRVCFVVISWFVLAGNEKVLLSKRQKVLNVWEWSCFIGQYIYTVSLFFAELKLCHLTLEVQKFTWNLKDVKPKCGILHSSQFVLLVTSVFLFPVLTTWVLIKIWLPMIRKTWDSAIYVRDPQTDGASQGGVIIHHLRKPTEMTPTLFVVAFSSVIFRWAARNLKTFFLSMAKWWAAQSIITTALCNLKMKNQQMLLLQKKMAKFIMGNE